MRSQRAVPFVDTNVIPDRNAGIGSLLWDLQNPQDPDRDGPPLVNREFAFIDVGVSRAKTSTALKALLATDLKMDVDYVATERPGAVPYAHVTPLGDSAEKIREHLSGMSPSKETTHEVADWHYVVDRTGRVSGVSYSYRLYGNEVWESYLMGRTFIYSGDEVDFSDPKLDELLSPDVEEIELKIGLERQRDSDPSEPGPSWDGYRIERTPLQSGLAEWGITLQENEIPDRIEARQNVLFVGNVLNHYPEDVQAFELDRISANMEAGDLVIVQMDGMELPTIEVLLVRGQGARKTRERARWIDTKNVELRKPVRGTGSWQQIHAKPGVERMVSRLVECLGRKVDSQKWAHRNYQVVVHQLIGHVFLTWFRALPGEETLRAAVREALRRLPSEGGLTGIPVFKDDARDAHGDPLRSNWIDLSPIVSETDFVELMLAGTSVKRTHMAETQASNLTGSWN